MSSFKRMPTYSEERTIDKIGHTEHVACTWWSSGKVDIYLHLCFKSAWDSQYAMYKKCMYIMTETTIKKIEGGLQTFDFVSRWWPSAAFALFWSAKDLRQASMHSPSHHFPCTVEGLWTCLHPRDKGNISLSFWLFNLLLIEQFARRSNEFKTSRPFNSAGHMCVSAELAMGSGFF